MKKDSTSSNKWLALLFTCLLLSCTVCNAATTETLKPDTITLSLTEAGTLHERIGNNKKLKIECLRLTGMLNIDDIQFIRERPDVIMIQKGTNTTATCAILTSAAPPSPTPTTKR